MNLKTPLAAVCILAAMGWAGGAEKKLDKKPNAPVDYNSVVAVVNGEKITRGDLAEALIRVSGQRALDVLVKRKLIDQEAKKAGITVTKKEIQQGIKDRINELLDMEMRRQGYQDLKSFKRFLASKNLSLQTLRKRIAASLSPDIYRETEAVLKATKLIQANVKVTDEDIRKKFEEVYGPYVEASQIVVRTRREAREIRRKLLHGADFARLAKALSIDHASAARGGRMNAPLRPTDGALWAVCQGLKPGDISPVAPTRYGYHILKVHRIRTRPEKKLEDVKDKLAEMVREEKGREYLRTWYVKLLEKSDVRKMLEPPKLPGPIPIPTD